MIIRTVDHVTYGDLADLLKRLGFEERVRDDVRSYRHPSSGAHLLFPPLPLDQPVRGYHLAAARAEVDGFGILTSVEFDRMISHAAATKSVHK